MKLSIYINYDRLNRDIKAADCLIKDQKWDGMTELCHSVTSKTPFSHLSVDGMTELHVLWKSDIFRNAVKEVSLFGILLNLFKTGVKASSFLFATYMLNKNFII